MSRLDEKLNIVNDEHSTDGGDRISNLLLKYPAAEWMIPALLCAVLLGQLILCGRQLSQTADEATHLYSGYRYVKCGDFSVSPEHPPLAKTIAAVPLMFMNFGVDCAPFEGDEVQQQFAALKWLYSQDWPAALERARMAVSVFTVGLCLLVWIAARRMFGIETAIVAGLLLIFDPNLLAYGSLVLTDVPVTCMLLMTVLGFYLWTERRTAPLLLLTALAAGLTLLAKESGVVVLPILGALAIVDVLTPIGDTRSKKHRAFHNLLAIVLIAVLAIGIVWLGYGMRFADQSNLAQRPEMPAAAAFSGEGIRLALEDHHLLPRAYLEGFAAALKLSNRSSAAFVAGRMYVRAPWFSTPFNGLIRNTTAMLATMVFGALGVALTFRRNRREYLFLLVPLAIYVAVCIRASGNVSVRYLLPAFPYLLLAVAAGVVHLARRSRWRSYALLCLVVLHAASSLHAYPNYLSYASELWGGPSHAYKYLPWVDLGQSYPEAKTYLEEHRAQNCWFVTGWQVDPAFYGVPCRTFGLYLTHEMPPQINGTVIVSSTLLTDVRPAEEELAAPFRNAIPTARLGGSALLVYEGEFNTKQDASVGERNLASYAFSTGQLAAALEHGRKAVDLDPVSPLAHANLCMLEAGDRVDLAIKECTAARDLLLRDPLREEQTRKQYLESLGHSLGVLRDRYKAIYGWEPETPPDPVRR